MAKSHFSVENDVTVAINARVVFKTLVNGVDPDLFMFVPFAAYARMTSANYDWIRQNFSSRVQFSFLKEGLAPPAVHDLYCTQMKAAEIMASEDGMIVCCLPTVEDGKFLFHYCGFLISRFLDQPLLYKEVEGPQLSPGLLVDRSVESAEFSIVQRRRIDTKTLGDMNYGREKAFHHNANGVVMLCDVRAMVAAWRVNGFKASARRYKQKFKGRHRDEIPRGKAPGKFKLLPAVRDAIVKYFDFTSLAISIGAGANLTDVALIPQGVGQSQRIADTIMLSKIFMNYSLYIANADIVTTVELKYYKWVPSTGLGTPSIAELLQNPAAANALAHENFENQQMFARLWQKRFRAVGTATNPTTASNFGRNNQRIPIGKDPIQKFVLGGTAGSNQLYLMSISDSALTPFPILNLVNRIYFKDTVDPRNRDNRML